MAKVRVVGLDVHKDSIVVAVADGSSWAVNVVGCHLTLEDCVINGDSEVVGAGHVVQIGN